MRDRTLAILALGAVGIYAASRLPDIARSFGAGAADNILRTPQEAIETAILYVDQAKAALNANSPIARASSGFEDFTGVAVATHEGLVQTTIDDPRAIYQRVDGSVWRNP